MSRLVETESSAISAFRYDEGRRALYIRYRGGAAYTYHAVPARDYVALEKAESKGTFVNHVIKPKYKVTKGAPI